MEGGVTGEFLHVSVRGPKGAGQQFGLAVSEEGRHLKRFSMEHTVVLLEDSVVTIGQRLEIRRVEEAD
jgi:hypothetical protein